MKANVEKYCITLSSISLILACSLSSEKKVTTEIQSVYFTSENNTTNQVLKTTVIRPGYCQLPKQIVRNKNISQQRYRCEHEYGTSLSKENCQLLEKTSRRFPPQTTLRYQQKIIFNCHAI